MPRETLGAVMEMDPKNEEETIEQPDQEADPQKEERAEISGKELADMVEGDEGSLKEIFPEMQDLSAKARKVKETEEYIERIKGVIEETKIYSKNVIESLREDLKVGPVAEKARSRIVQQEDELKRLDDRLEDLEDGLVTQKAELEAAQEKLEQSLGANHEFFVGIDWTKINLKDLENETRGELKARAETREAYEGIEKNKLQLEEYRQNIEKAQKEFEDLKIKAKTTLDAMRNALNAPETKERLQKNKEALGAKKPWTEGKNTYNERMRKIKEYIDTQRTSMLEGIDDLANEEKEFQDDSIKRLPVRLFRASEGVRDPDKKIEKFNEEYRAVEKQRDVLAKAAEIWLKGSSNEMENLKTGINDTFKIENQ